MTELEQLKQELYGDLGNRIADIKLYPGTSREAGPEDVARGIRAAIKDTRENACEPIDLTY